MTAERLPRLDPGVTLLRRPAARAAPLHRLVVAALGRRPDASARWVDARGDAVTHALYDLAPSRARLDGLRVARAFTAHQHHALVRRVVREDSAVDLVVAPAVAAPYRDDDLHPGEAEDLLAATLALLRAHGDLGARVLVSACRDDERATRVADVADATVRAERTAMGWAYDAPGFETRVYRGDGWWQTTVPYWVALCGGVAEPRRRDLPGRTAGDVDADADADDGAGAATLEAF
jgi:hypothetical protein